MVDVAVAIDFVLSIAVAAGASLLFSSGASVLVSTLAKWFRKLRTRTQLGRIEVDLLSAEESATKIQTLLSGPQAFISYSHEDEDLARSLADYLVAHGIRAWRPKTELAPGDNLEKKIREGLSTSGYFLALMSPAYAQSQWAMRELKYALDREKHGKWPRVIPLVIGDTIVPELVADRVYLDLRGDSQDDLSRVQQAILRSSVQQTTDPD